MAEQFRSRFRVQSLLLVAVVLGVATSAFFAGRGLARSAPGDVYRAAIVQGVDPFTLGAHLPDRADFVRGEVEAADVFRARLAPELDRLLGTGAYALSISVDFPDRTSSVSTPSTDGLKHASSRETRETCETAHGSTRFEKVTREKSDAGPTKMYYESMECGAPMRNLCCVVTRRHLRAEQVDAITALAQCAVGPRGVVMVKYFPEGLAAATTTPSRRHVFISWLLVCVLAAVFTRRHFYRKREAVAAREP